MRVPTLLRRTWPLALVGGFAATAVLAASAPLPTLSLVSDLTPGEETADRGYVAVLGRLGNVLLAHGTDPLHGTELWRYNLDGSGGERIADLCPGECGSFPYPDSVAVLGDHLLFVASDTSHGRELWSTDGTAAGTHLVRDICPGPCSAITTHGPGKVVPPVVVGHQVFFAADDGRSGQELWRTDGTAAGTAQAVDINPGANGSDLAELVSFRGLAYLLAHAGSSGFVLWQSDGTPAGTERLAACGGSCQGHLLGASADWLLFETAASCLGSTPSNLVAIDRAGHLHEISACAQGSTVTFAGEGAFVVGSSPRRLWHVDLAHGTAVDLGQGRFSDAADGRLAGSLFFFAGDDAEGVEPWVSDGTLAGTRRLADISPGSLGSYPQMLGAVGNRIIFSAESPDAGREPWVSDGTPEGTHPLGDLWPGPFLTPPEGWSGSSDPQGFASLGATALFVAKTAEGKELWRTDGTPAGTVRVASLATRHGRSTTVYPLSTWDERAIWFTPHFPQDTQPVTDEVWISDGTAAGTRQLTAAAAVASDISLAVPQARNLYIAGTSAVLMSDGTAAAGASVPGSYDRPQQLRAAGSRLYFLANAPAGTGSPALFGFASGGAAMEIRQLSFPANLTPVGDRLFFTDLDLDQGPQLLFARGQEIAQVCVGTCGPTPHELTPFGERLLFLTFGAGATRGVTLWISDGTAAGTLPLHAFPAGDLADAVITPRDFAPLGNRMFFLAGTAAGDELWSTDGTPAGTTRVLAFSGFGGFSQSGDIVTARSLTAAGTRLFLAVDTPAAGEEPWVSDGTAAGTRMVADLRPGPESSAPREIAAVGNRVVFAADDGDSGLELWASDGTAGRTFLVADVAAGPDSSSPDEVEVTSDRIFFTADDGLHGREVWSLAREAVLTDTCQPSATTLCLQGGRFAVTARWQAPSVFPGQAQVVPAIATEQTGGFWFFDPSNTELLVKILDGGVVNDHFWVFYGALSDVAYQIQVRDLATGLVRIYKNPAGNLCGRADVAAFPHASAAAAPPALPAKSDAALPPPDLCHPADPSGLCLGPNGRFFVRVAVVPPGAHDPVFATPRAGTGDTGFFWFFDPANLELAVKVLDGTAVNGRFWVFFGALSDVHYIVTVADTQTGVVKSYDNPQGQLCGRADVAAF